MTKIRLDECYLCGESRAAIKYSQSMKDPIYCGIMSGGESPELMQEFDHHVFIVTQEQIDRDKAAEAKMYEDMAGMADFMYEDTQS